MGNTSISCDYFGFDRKCLREGLKKDGLQGNGVGAATGGSILVVIVCNIVCMLSSPHHPHQFFGILALQRGGGHPDSTAQYNHVLDLIQRMSDCCDLFIYGIAGNFRGV